MIKRTPKAFTLIELLIVVAIIGILAAIAVPNFLNAQLRAKIARTNGDLKALSSAIDAYFLDTNFHPNNRSHLTVHLHGLTTPISYISTVGFRDIFKAEQGNTGNNQESYLYFNYFYHPNPPNGWNTWMHNVNRADLSTKGYCLASWGPDRNQDAIEWVYIQNRMGNEKAGNLRIYHPSNGLISQGDIGRWGGNVPGVQMTAGG
ncbi:prepilin-type N-terminal cleavage/methylation domain-containing protein [bacterium]|nr:prepilin-type N-terminal cleavage/methylation domain-containing protein [bacterium]